MSQISDERRRELCQSHPGVIAPDVLCAGAFDFGPSSHRSIAGGGTSTMIVNLSPDLCLSGTLLQ